MSAALFALEKTEQKEESTISSAVIRNSKNFNFHFFEEFDPGSGLTLAMCLTHASRAARKGSGGRLSNTSITYP